MRSEMEEELLTYPSDLTLGTKAIVRVRAEREPTRLRLTRHGGLSGEERFAGKTSRDVQNKEVHLNRL
jgi:hypothetical protein